MFTCLIKGHDWGQWGATYQLGPDRVQYRSCYRCGTMEHKKVQ